MNEAIIERHNSVVKPDDVVYHLGDEALNDIVTAANCIRRLNGEIHLIRGNHSTDNKIEYIINNCYNVVEVADAKILTVGGYHFFLSHYPCLCANYDEDKPLRKRCISLCGHSHVTDKFADFDKGLIYHVEQESHNCYPVTIEQIISDIQKKISSK